MPPSSFRAYFFKMLALLIAIAGVGALGVVIVGTGNVYAITGGAIALIGVVVVGVQQILSRDVASTMAHSLRTPLNGDASAVADAAPPDE